MTSPEQNQPDPADQEPGNQPDDTTPHEGNPAQAAAVFGDTSEAPPEMDSGGAG